MRSTSEVTLAARAEDRAIAMRLARARCSDPPGLAARDETARSLADREWVSPGSVRDGARLRSGVRSSSVASARRSRQLPDGRAVSDPPTSSKTNLARSNPQARRLALA